MGRPRSLGATDPLKTPQQLKEILLPFLIKMLSLLLKGRPHLLPEILTLPRVSSSPPALTLHSSEEVKCRRRSYRFTISKIIAKLWEKYGTIFMRINIDGIQLRRKKISFQIRLNLWLWLNLSEILNLMLSLRYLGVSNEHLDSRLGCTRQGEISWYEKKEGILRQRKQERRNALIICYHSPTSNQGVTPLSLRS